MHTQTNEPGSGPARSGRRCSRCGGLNPPDADWCGLCHRSFAPPPPPPHEPAGNLLFPLDDPGPGGAAPPAASPDPLTASSFDQAAASITDPLTAHGFDPLSAPSFDPAAESDPVPRFDPLPDPTPAAGQPRLAPVTPEPVRAGHFVIAGGAISWTCSFCDQENPLDASLCSVCGATFARVVRDPEPERPARDPNTTALYSLFFPGAGHAYLGLWGQAVARSVLSLWVLVVAVVSALAGTGGGAVLVAVTFTLAAFVLWLVSAHDAYREASGEGRLVLLRGRGFLFVTMGLLGLLFLMLMVGVVGAGGVSPPAPG